MYRIVFRFLTGYGYRYENYGGGFYRMNGEKYAVFDNRTPKLYKSEKTARRVADTIATTCVNGIWDYEIIKEDKK